MADGGEEGGGCLAPLPSATVNLLKSSQVTKTFWDKTGSEMLVFKVVTSVWSGVKELVENAIDAQATHIEVINMILFQNSGGEYMTYMAQYSPCYWSLCQRIFLAEATSTCRQRIDIPPPARPQY